MRARFRRRVAAAAVVAATLAVPRPSWGAGGAAGRAGTGAGSGGGVDFIAVSANTGQSAGGHSALRVGRTVYHFQAGGDRRLSLRRDPLEYFDERYRHLDNRSLTRVPLDLDRADARVLKDGLDRQYLAQQQQVARLSVLEVEAEWFGALAAGEASGAVELPVAGYFETTSHGATVVAAKPGLAATLEAALGAGFLETAARLIDSELAAEAFVLSDLSSPPATGERPVPSLVAADRRRDRLLVREAVDVIRTGRGLVGGAALDPDGVPLRGRERGALEGFRSDLEGSLARLFRSSRPGRGGALLLAVARHRAVERTLATGRWHLLDCLPHEAELLSPDEIARHGELVQELLGQAGERWARVRGEVTADGSLSQLDYSRLEDLASRFAAPREAAFAGEPIYGAGPQLLVPVRRGSVRVPEQALAAAALRPGDGLRRAEAGARARADAYRQGLDHAYRYSLVRRNCSTELARAMVAAFPNPGAAAAAFGGSIDPDSGFAFLPARLAHGVRGLDAADEAYVAPSRRLVGVAGLGGGLGVALRESSPLTSSVYPGSIEDDRFLFFSDGPKKYLRPLQGLANLGYGVTAGAAGLLVLPFDRGELARQGWRGAIYSVPEIGGFSVRKGRYDTLPEGRVLEADGVKARHAGDG